MSLRYHEIAEAYHRILNPFSEDQLMLLGDICSLQPDDRQLDLACGKGEMFGPGNAQLPTPNMLMMDRITRITDHTGSHGKGEILAELDITPDLWFVDCHFPGDPVFDRPGGIGSLQLGQNPHPVLVGIQLFDLDQRGVADGIKYAHN